MVLLFFLFFETSSVWTLKSFAFPFSFQVTYFTLMSFIHLDLMGFFVVVLLLLYKVRDRDEVTFFCIWKYKFAITVSKEAFFFPVHAFYNSVKYYMVIAVYVYFLITYFIIFISVSEFDFCANASFLLHGFLVWNPYTEIHWSMFFWFKSVLVTVN